VGGDEAIIFIFLFDLTDVFVVLNPE